MAVAYANSLSKRIEASFLCCTRTEGGLKGRLEPGVGYFYLGKKSTLDITAFLRLRSFIKEHNITVIHAHSSSFFLAVFLKFFLKQVKLVWHDHLGERVHWEKAPLILRWASYWFDGIISVNKPLAAWSGSKLHSKKVCFIKNFLQESGTERTSVKLDGENTFRIICVANFRREKDHLTLLEAFRKVLLESADISLHLLGKDENDLYSKEIKKYIRDKNLSGKVFIYGLQANIPDFLKQADLGVLSSVNEGLPVALLEYGMAELAVVSTAVGNIPEVLEGTGKLVPPENPEALGKALLFYIRNDIARREDSKKLYQKIKREYSEEAVLPEIIQFYKFL